MFIELPNTLIGGLPVLINLDHIVYVSPLTPYGNDKAQCFISLVNNHIKTSISYEEVGKLIAHTKGIYK